MARKIEGQVKDLDGFSVTRILPHKEQRMVGPFTFLDHMGPADFAPGEGIDVRPHPHIGLSTITYMLEGAMLHRDSLGNNLEVLPGDVNWMTAGRGIVHSERETIEVKASQHRLNGIQAWVALPEDMAEIEPSFTHIKKAQLPHCMHDGVIKRLIAGEAFGMTSPLKTYSPMFYLDVIAKAGSMLDRPNPEQDCLIYVLDGEVRIGGETFCANESVVLEEHDLCLECLSYSRVLMLGGEAFPTAPHMFWNFVSFSRERIDQASRDWKEGKFPKIPGDSCEYTPVPEK